MKKIKWILLAITLALATLFLFATCRKTKAMESVFYNYSMQISERDQDQYNAVLIFNVSQKSNYSSNILYIDTNNSLNYVYLNVSADTSILRIYNRSSVSLENISLTSGLIEVDIVYDTYQLYCIIYEISFNVQRNQGVEPILDGITRTMKTRFQLNNYILTDWQSGDIDLSILNAGNYSAGFLVNGSYISVSDTPQNISDWVSSQLNNSLTYNKLIHEGYLAGNEDGYLDGFDDGEDRGYSDGYDAGEADGYQDGYNVGTVEGFDDGYLYGYDEGYHRGWDAGQAGETAITPVFNTLSSIFGVVGSVLAIELVPHVPIGLFFLVPLFFSAIGLILWIWRRN